MTGRLLRAERTKLLTTRLPAVLAGAVAVTFALFTALGTAVGSLLRSTVLALAIGLGWFVVVEPLLPAIEPSLDIWLPGAAAAVLANLANTSSIPDGTREVAGAVAVLCGYVALLVAAALVATRRDHVR